jgi:hypothetical protein
MIWKHKKINLNQIKKLIFFSKVFIKHKNKQRFWKNLNFVIFSVN